MGIGAVSELIGRSPDTLRRWEKDGLLLPQRDGRGRRRYTQQDIERCFELARLSRDAQYRSQKLRSVVDERPEQLTLLAYEQQ